MKLVLNAKVEAPVVEEVRAVDMVGAVMAAEAEVGAAAMAEVVVVDAVAAGVVVIAAVTAEVMAAEAAEETANQDFA
jgi:hypothetical protein